TMQLAEALAVELDVTFGDNVPDRLERPLTQGGRPCQAPSHVARGGLSQDQGQRRRASDPSASQARSNSPVLIPAVNATHSSGVKVSLGPSGSFESRTATAPGRLRATSTQSPALPPLHDDLRHSARLRSISPSPSRSAQATPSARGPRPATYRTPAYMPSRCPADRLFAPSPPSPGTRCRAHHRTPQ